jgi:type IV pilus assembly protein PilX
MNTSTRRDFGRQNGAVLFVALIFLLLITLLSLTAIGTSVLQEKMTGGMRNRQLGMMGAESALRGTEAWLWSLSFTAAAGQPLPPCIGTSTGTCVYRPQIDGTLRPSVQSFRTSTTWVDRLPGTPNYAHVLTGLGGDAETASLAAQPVVLVEDLGANVPPGAGSQSGAIDPERMGGAGAAWFYRITARSQGGSGAVVRVAESVFSSANLTNTGIEP